MERPMRRTASEVLRELESRVARLEERVARLRPNRQLCDLVIASVMAKVERATELSTRLFERGLTLHDAHFAEHYSKFPSYNAIQRAIAEKDYAKIERRARSLRRSLDDSSDWDDIETSFKYMLPAIQIVGHLTERDDVWGETGFRKFKLAWGKFVKSAVACWSEFSEITEEFKDLQDSALTGGVTLHFTYHGGRNKTLAQMNFATGELTVNLSDKRLRNKKVLRAVVEHELVHYEQHLEGLRPAENSSHGGGSYWVEHSLMDSEFDPRLNDVSNAISDLIEVGLDAQSAISILANGGAKPEGVDDYLFDSAQQWLSTLRQYDGRKYQRALREIEGDFL